MQHLGCCCCCFDWFVIDEKPRTSAETKVSKPLPWNGNRVCNVMKLRKSRTAQYLDGIPQNPESWRLPIFLLGLDHLSFAQLLPSCMAFARVSPVIPHIACLMIKRDPSSLFLWRKSSLDANQCVPSSVPWKGLFWICLSCFTPNTLTQFCFFCSAN